MSLIELEARLNDAIHDLALLAGKAEARRLVKMLMHRHCGIDWTGSTEPHTEMANETDYWLSISDGMPLYEPSDHEDMTIMQLDGTELLSAPYVGCSARGTASPLSAITHLSISRREKTPRQGSAILPTIDPRAGMLHVTPLRCVSPTGDQSGLTPTQEFPVSEVDRRPWTETSDTVESLMDKSSKPDSLSASLVSNTRQRKLCSSDSKFQGKKRRLSGYYRNNLVEFLGRHWKYLQSVGLFDQMRSNSSPLVLDVQPVYGQLRMYYHILREMEGMNDIHPYRRAVAEYRTLEGYNQVMKDVRTNWAVGYQARRGDSAKNLAHKEYVKKMFPDARDEEIANHSKRLKYDLENARRWAILIEGTHEYGHEIPGAGEGLLLAVSPATIRTINKKSAAKHSDLKQLLRNMRRDQVFLSYCNILKSAGESLLRKHRLPAELEWDTMYDRLQQVTLTQPSIPKSRPNVPTEVSGTSNNIVPG